jgi:hypothetical protein
MARHLPFALLLAGLLPLGALAQPAPTPGQATLLIGQGGTGPLPADPATPFTPVGNTVVPGTYGLDCSNAPCVPAPGSIITVGGSPAPEASVSLNGGEVSGNGAFAYVTYQYSVVGLNPGDTTPGQLILNLQTSFSDPQDLESSYAEVRLDGGTPYLACSGITQCYGIAGGTSSYASSITGAQAVTLQQTGEIALLADVGISFLPNAHGYALADPVLIADNGDLIELSDGFANATLAAPEPASALLLAAGLAGVAGARRRLRRG